MIVGQYAMKNHQYNGGVLIWSAATCRRFSSIAFFSAMTEIESGDKSPHSKLGHCQYNQILDSDCFASYNDSLFKAVYR
jgi:hypothetical protein